MNKQHPLLFFAAAIVLTVCAVFTLLAVPTSRAEGVLIAHYEFEDPGDLGHDSSGNENHAEVVEEVEQVDGPEEFGKGGFFDESLASNFHIGPLDGGFTGKPGVTLAAWVKLDEASTGFDGIISQDAGGCCQNRILLHPDHAVFINLSEHNDRHLNAGPLLEFDVWTHVAMVGEDIDGEAEARVYVNGEEIEGSPQIFPEMDDGSDWNTYLGVGESGTAHRLTGALDDARVYEGALTEEEIQGLLTPGSDPDLVGWYTFDEGDGDLATDSSGNGHDGEIIGDAPEWVAEGKIGGALFLPGTDEFVEIADTDDHEFAEDQPFSIAVWLKSDLDDNDNGFVTKGYHDDSRDPNYWMLQSLGEGFGFDSRCCDGGGTPRIKPQAGGDSDDDEWHHFAVVRDIDEGMFFLYLDGEETGVVEMEFDGGNWDMGVNDDPTVIGNHFNRFTPSLFDDLGIWRRALSPDEISEIMEDGIVALAGGTPPPDTDRDGLPDEYEDKEENGCLDKNVADSDQDQDNDTLTSLAEFELRTNPCKADTDADGLQDNVETNTEVWVDANNTGTSPLKDDTDKDGLKDGVENPTLPFVDANQSGTDPNKRDTDGDGVGDGSEVAGGTDPTDGNSVPSVISGGGVFETTHVWTEGDPQISDVVTAEEVTLDPGDAENITVEHPWIHYHDNVNAPVFQDLSEPYPLWGPEGNDEGPGDRNDFAIRSIGNINITQSGTITFVCNSDDGFDLRIDGDSIGEAGNRGRGNTFMEVDLDAGIHEVEFIHWERGGGAGVSVYVFRSVGDAGTTLNDSEWQLLEASGGGGVLFQITSVALGDGNLTISWPSSPGESFTVETGSNLEQWEELTDGLESGGETTEFVLALPDPAPETLWIRVIREE
jgi:hypothetical protein